MNSTDSIHSSVAAEALAARPSGMNRVRGALLLGVGVALALVCMAILFTEAPLWLNPGKSFDGNVFTGTPSQGWIAVGLLAWLALMGLVFAAGGIQLWRSGTVHPWFKRIFFTMLIVTFIGIQALLRKF
jgi:hypothetical protein